MAVDASNLLRVDLQDIYTACERQTALRSEAYDGGETLKRVAVGQDDYGNLLPFIIEGMGKVANAANYISSTAQTGFDALSRKEPDPTDKTLDEIPESTKLLGEALDPDIMDVLVFGIDQLSNIDVNRYTIIQGFILESLVHYTLYKWYHMKGMFDWRNQEEALYEKSLMNVKSNSINNYKTKKIRRPNRLY